MSLNASNADTFHALQRATGELLAETPRPAKASESKIEIQYGYHEIQGRREAMEDAHMALNAPEGSGIDAFFGVFDGHGGHRAADWVSVNIYKAFLAAPGFRAGDYEAALAQAILACEDEFMEFAMDVEDASKELHDGTTVVVAVVVENKLYVANCGDSEAVLAHGSEALKLSETHNPKQNEAEGQRVLDAGGKLFHRRVAHPKFNPAVMSIAVSRSIGDAGFKHERYVQGKTSGLIATPYVVSRELTAEDDFLILACDGLWDVSTPAEAIDMVRGHLAEGKTPQEVATLVTEWAYANGSTDNITVLIVAFEYHDEPGWATPSVSGSGLSPFSPEAGTPAKGEAPTADGCLATPGNSDFTDVDWSTEEEEDHVLLSKLYSEISVLRRALAGRVAEVDALTAENDALLAENAALKAKDD